MNRIKQMWDDLSFLKKTGIVALLILSTIILLKKHKAPTFSQMEDESKITVVSGYGETPKTVPVMVEVAPGTQMALPTPKIKEKPKSLTLSKNNTIVFREVVTAESVAKIEREMMDMSNAIPATQPIYLVMNTPGGSVDAGLEFINFVKALPQKVHTVTLFSASMGFHIVQSLDDRLIVPDGVLMSHRVSGSGLEGQMPGSMVTRLNFSLRRFKNMDERVAARVKMPLADYQEMIRDEYWVYGEESVEAGMADKVVAAKCDHTLSGTKTMTVDTFLGPVSLTMSECPLITAPLGVDFGKMKFKSEEEQVRVMKFIKTLIEDPETFVQTYIMQGQYKEYLSN